MASPLDLKGRVVMVDAGATATLNKVKAGMHGVAAAGKRATGATPLGAFSANAMSSMALATNRLNRSLLGLRGTMLTTGFAVGGMMAATRNFNEAKFGYGFARITDYIKDGKLQLDAWKQAMNAAGKEARDQAENLGLSPDTTMKAREDVEKVGRHGVEAKALTDASLALHMADPRNLDAGEAVKYLNAIYNGFAEERKARAAAQGTTVDDPKFIESYWKGLSAKSAVAASQSALDPRDLIEGLRQYAPQWGPMGISSEFAMAALAHGSNYGFRAPELGTAYKSLVNKIIKPTDKGLRWYNTLGIDREKYMEMGAIDPKTGANRINDLLGGGLKADHKAKVRGMIESAMRDGRERTPEFRAALANFVESKLGKGFTGNREQIESAISDSVYGAQKFKEGGLDGLIKEIINKKAGPNALMEMFEGRHYARNSPAFQFYDGLYKLYEQLQGVGPEVADAVVEGRKDSEAGKLDAFYGSLQNLVGKMTEAGGVMEKFTTGMTGLTNALAAMPSGALATLTTSLIGLATASALISVGSFMRLGKVFGFVAKLIAQLSGGAGAGAAAAAAGGASAASAAGVGAGAVTAGGKAVGGAAGRVMPVLGIGLAGYEGYSEYQKAKAEGFTEGQAATRGAIYGVGNAVTFGGLGLVDAATTGGPTTGYDPAAGAAKFYRDGGAASNPAASAKYQADQAVSEAQSAADAITQALGIDLHAAGVQAMQTFAAGISAGGAAAISAAQSVAGQVRAAGQGVKLNTGPNMQPTR